MTDDRLADPVVVGLDVVQRPGAGAADQVVGSERGQVGKPRRPSPVARVASAWRSGRPATASTSSRSRAFSGSRLIRAQSTSSSAIGPGLRAVLQLAAGVEVLDQLVDEVGAPARLPRDHPGLLLGELVVVAQQLEGQRRRLVAAEGVDHDLAPGLGGRPETGRIQQHAEAGAVRGVLAPVGADQQQERRIGRLE